MREMTHRGTAELSTERLLLRRFSLRDAQPAFENWLSEEKVTRFLTFEPYKSVREVRKILRKWTRGYARPDFYQWAIVLKESMQPVGTIDAKVIDADAGYMRVGYCLGSKWWGKGIMTEALKEVLAFLFGQVGAGRIEARHDANNPASGKVMQKCGMSYEGTLRRSAKSNVGIYDALVYAIVQE